jgi:hexosaminidase
MDTTLSLVPLPQQVEVKEGHFSLPQQPLIYLAAAPQQIYNVGQHLVNMLEGLGLTPELTAAPAGEPAISLWLEPSLLPRPQSYRIIIDRTGVTIVGGDEPGLFYGVCTLAQLVRTARKDEPIQLPHVKIVDWPDFAHRGLMFDVTRDKVPTMETLYSLVEMLAGLKINQLQLYTEHTFAYRGHEEVWKEASPLTGEEILALDAYCRGHYIELAPNQNSFGHMHRWLKHDTYRHLAEIPEGWMHPFHDEREPYSICPSDPGSLELLADLYDQLLPHFSSRQVNVGLDETFDLGMGRSKELCEAQGTERVYLDFLLKVYDLIRRRGGTMQFWGDIIIKRPELIAELPKDLVALEWGYEADHPFAEHGKLFADAGLSFYVCPGTSSWNTLVGRTENALGNLRSAAINGQKNGAIGYLITDWGDFGHMQPLPVSYLGYVAGAAYSWRVATAEDEAALDLPSLLDTHVFHDQAGVMGKLVYDFGNVYRETGVTPHNSSTLFWQLILPSIDTAGQQEGAEAGIASYVVQLRKMAGEANYDAASESIGELVSALDQTEMARPDAEWIVEEYRWVADMLTFAARLGSVRSAVGMESPMGQLPANTRAALADELRPLIERHKQVWLLRNRPGGMEDSSKWLRKVLKQLEG